MLATAALVVAAAPAEAAPKRVVALTPFTANTLAEVGHRPVAIGQTLGGHARFHRRLRGVRTLPLAHPNGPNLEQLTTLRPKLVFSSPTWRKSAQTMRNLGMRVEEADPGRVSQVGAAMRRASAPSSAAGRPPGGWPSVPPRPGPEATAGYTSARG